MISVSRCDVVARAVPLEREIFGGDDVGRKADRNVRDFERRALKTFLAGRGVVDDRGATGFHGLHGSWCTRPELRSRST